MSILTNIFQRGWNHQLDRYFMECHKASKPLLTWKSPWHRFSLAPLGPMLLCAMRKPNLFLDVLGRTPCTLKVRMITYYHFILGRANWGSLHQPEFNQKSRGFAKVRIWNWMLYWGVLVYQTGWLHALAEIFVFFVGNQEDVFSSHEKPSMRNGYAFPETNPLCRRWLSI